MDTEPESHAATRVSMSQLSTEPSNTWIGVDYTDPRLWNSWWLQVVADES